jgi:hypothetical protein
MAETVYNHVKDSGGPRENFGNGSVRDSEDGKGRFDLISTIALRRLANHYQNGAKKYGDRNWEKGQRLGRFVSSAMRHLQCLLEGKKDEDHAAAVAWNAFAVIHIGELIKQGKLPKEFDDIYYSSDPETEQNASETLPSGQVAAT